MVKKIFKYDLVIEYKQVVKLPAGANILSVQSQYESPKIWALVDPSLPLVERHFELFGTGHDVPCDMGVEREFIGTFQLNQGEFVFHLFERIN